MPLIIKRNNNQQGGTSTGNKRALFGANRRVGPAQVSDITPSQELARRGQTEYRWMKLIPIDQIPFRLQGF